MTIDHVDFADQADIEESLNAVIDLVEELDTAKWDDLRFPATAINPAGAAGPPGFDTTNIGFLFDKTLTEVVAIIGQMPHAWLEGSAIYPHVHWQRSATGTVNWQLEYKWVNNGELVPAGFQTINVESEAYAYTSGDLMQISKFPAIDGTGKKISSVLIMKLSRVGGTNDTYDQDALMFEFDIHYQVDSTGSIQEYIKQS